MAMMFLGLFADFLVLFLANLAVMLMMVVLMAYSVIVTIAVVKAIGGIDDIQ